MSNNPHSRCAWCGQGFYGSSNHVFSRHCCSDYLQMQQGKTVYVYGKNAKKPDGFHQSQVKLFLPCPLTCVVQDSIANLLAQMFPFTCVSPVIFSLTWSCVSRTSWSPCHRADSACKQTLFTIHQPCRVRWSSWRNSASFLTQKHRFCRLGLPFSSAVQLVFSVILPSFPTTTSLQDFSAVLAVIT